MFCFSLPPILRYCTLNTIRTALLCLLTLLSIESAAISTFTIDQLPSKPPSLATTGATVLHRSVEIDVAEDGLATTRYLVRVWIHDQKAVMDYGQIEIERNRFLEELTLDMARVHTPAGDIKTLAKDAMQVQSLSEENAFFDNERLVFALPALQPGAVIEFAYTRQQIKPTITGHFSASHSFYWWESQAGNMAARLDPVMNSEIHVRYPSSMVLQYTQSPLVKNAPTKTLENGHTRLHWQTRSLPKFEPQSYMPNTLSHHPLVVVSSIPSWQTINTWAQTLTAPKIEATPRLKSVAEQIAKQHKDRDARIRAVHAYLEQNVRYVFAHVGRGGYEPHMADAVLSNGYGDCKDQTVLTLTLLNELGIEAYPALVSSKGRGLEDIDLPTLRFDHMFVYIPATENSEAIWFDTTGEQIDFPGLHWSYVGQRALVVNGRDNQLIEVRPAYTMEHATNVALAFSYSNENDVRAIIEVTFTGLMGQHMRNMLMYVPDPQALIKESLAPIYPTAEISNMSHTINSQVRDGVTLKAQLDFKDAWQGHPSPMNYGLGINQFYNLGTYWSGLLPPEKRQQHFVQEAPFRIRVQAHMPPPRDDYSATLISSGLDDKNDYYHLQQSGQQLDDGSYQVKADLAIFPVDIPVAQYQDYFERITHAYDTSKWSIRFSPSTHMARAGDHLDDSQPVVAEINALIDKGQFDAAHSKATQLVESEADNPTAHYLLALSLAYLQRYEASNAALHTAVKLGFDL